MWREAANLRFISTAAPTDNKFGHRLNEQFANVVWKDADYPDLQQYLKNRGKRHPDLPTSFELFNLANVSEQFANIRNCAAGPDQLSGKLLHASRGKLVFILTRIFNACLNLSFCPIEWSDANITPIPRS